MTPKTAYVYHPVYLEHDKPDHPENARRLKRVLQVSSEHGLCERLTLLEPRPVTEKELLRVHTQAHIEHVWESAEGGEGYLDPDTYVCPNSFEAALMAAGGTVRAVEQVLSGEIGNAFALVRPPGHHATASRAMGFCLFNNVSVAAQAALAEKAVERVLIVDFDVHHGNGTADLFATNPDVYYFSVHQHPYYPGTGARGDVGRGAGVGTELNVPLPPNVGDEGYGLVFDELVWPFAQRCQPDLILVSAGYDGHWDDPLAHMALSLHGYGSIARTLVSMAERLCQGRLLFVLEGGYHLDALAYGVANTFSALLGDEVVLDPLGRYPRSERPVDRLVADLRSLHQFD